MRDDATTVPSAVRLHRRVGSGLRKPANWLQLVRFSAVGASGYAINLLVFAGAVSGLELHYRLAALLAFAVAVLNNFWWNRHWTFAAHDGHVAFQAARFLLVSVGALALNLGLLELLVSWGGVAEVPAQAIAVACATPVSFLGNKLWTFRR